MRALWSLPKAAPALLRHLAAYAELAALDIHRAQKEFGAHFAMLALAGMGLFFCFFFASVALIAYFWDTPYRVPAIACMAGVFLAVSVFALFRSAQLKRARTPFLRDVKSEWEQDRVILERILGDDEEGGP